MLAARGMVVIGFDPAGTSLDVARKKRGADRVAWVHGDLGALPALQVDLVAMTGNVAQIFVTDDRVVDHAQGLPPSPATRWPPGLRERRVPEDQAWLRWTRKATLHAGVLLGIGQVEHWVEVTNVRCDIVSFRSTYIFQTDGAVYASDSKLRFRSRAQIENALGEAGLAVTDVRGAPDRPGREFVFIAGRPD